jgi:gluconate 5-dehydrogenase
MAFELFELTGKRALVTGSSQGIGFALAQGLAEHDRDAAKLDAAAAKLAAAGHKVSVAGFDVTQAQAAKDGVEAIEKNSGAIDILINNAGMQFRSPLEDFPVEKWEQLLATNVSSAFYVGQARCAPHDPARPGQDHQHRIRAKRTRASRHRSLHGHEGRDKEPDPRHVRRLGEARPPDQCDRGGLLQDPAQTGAGRQSGVFELARKRTPAARWGNVEELFGAAVFLSGKASSFVNGHTLYVDGGITTCL